MLPTSLTMRALSIVLLLSALSACAGQPTIERVVGIPAMDRSQVAQLDTSVFSAGQFVAADGTALTYRLLSPATIEPGRVYPLVLQLHSSGAIGQDNQAQLDAMAKGWALPENRARYPAFVLVPQFPVRSANYDDPVVPRSAQASPALTSAMALVDELAARLPVDADRIYATGFSMGGSAAWLSPVLRPGRFAAIVPISGIAPADADAQALASLPILVMHGDADSENPIDADRRLVATLRARGNQQVRLREYVGLAHMPPGDSLPGQAWRDWLFAQRRAAVPASVPASE
ncbi:Phospholipase/Carboxylesterase [Pseudoxanthomonas indica]|uniref:Phospholipase/Carboxylesterase n=2 Tax=Pseudoxanthomonas indica TaxID=428993 RepID=A0A1T5KFE2_9GAMM|nr:phospholipase [Pseudoxanthomonas indica]SKC62436.1 Phospholipase/Carboxylesterase [Pseudoxanthomonas indica]